MGEWAAFYFPEQSWTKQDVDPSTGACGPIEAGGTIPAFFEVGETRVWSAWVQWDGKEPRYGEDPKNPISPHAQETLRPLHGKAS